MNQKHKRRGFLTTVVLIGLCVTAAKVQAAQATDEVRVLFIGNSFTYVNDLPKMVMELAKAGGQRPLFHEQETPGGCTLQKHWQDGKALAKIQSRKWEFVVLQEQSQIPSLQPDAMFKYGKKLDAEIRKTGAKTIFFMTWALQDKPNDQAAISKAYQDLANNLKAELAPVGNAWQAALSANKQLVLHAQDQKHPNRTGTYLAACVFYATIYDKSPEGLPGSIGSLTDEEAHPLQVIAWKTVHAMEK